MIPALWSTHWCQAQQGFFPPGSTSPGTGGHSRKPLRCLQVEGEEALAISWQTRPAWGTRSQVLLPCSGESRLQAPGSGRNFPPAHIATAPHGFFPSSAALSTTTCPSSSSHFGLLLLHHQDGLSCPAPGRRKAFFPHHGLARPSRGFLPSSAVLSRAPSGHFA